MAAGKLVLVRHGLSVYNDQNRFTGWKDVDLNQQGINEAKQAVGLLANYKFDMAFTSDLVRAQDTLNIILEGIEQTNIPVVKNFALNERDYGDLVGLNKQETADKFGKDQVHIWRRSYDTPPPNGESLKDVVERVSPYFKKNIKPLLVQNNNILIAAHGNSLRAMMIELGMYKPEEISSIELPTGSPLCINLEGSQLVDFFYLS